MKKTHGFLYLDKKEKKLLIKKSNTNDALNILGPPSTKGTFDNSVWIYIERVTTRGKLLKLGRNITKTNNVLVLNFDKYGLLESKEFYDLKKSNNIKFVKQKTATLDKRRDFIYNFLSSVRQKVNNPVNKQ